MDPIREKVIDAVGVKDQKSLNLTTGVPVSTGRKWERAFQAVS